MTEFGEEAFPVAQNLMQRLRADVPSQEVETVTEHIFEVLRSRLSSVLGASGYAVLLARSLALTRTEYPWLAGLKADSNGSILGQLAGAIAGRDPKEVGCGFAALLYRFVTLLTTFIGLDLTNRLLETVWQNLENTNPGKNRGDKIL